MPVFGFFSWESGLLPASLIAFMGIGWWEAEAYRLLT
jgi:hypothetical protein